jgi:hypothetical protein
VCNITYGITALCTAFKSERRPINSADVCLLIYDISLLLQLLNNGTLDNLVVKQYRYSVLLFTYCLINSCVIS